MYNNILYIYKFFFIKITKICYFRSWNIKLRENCVVPGKSEDKVVLRTQFNSRTC